MRTVLAERVFLLVVALGSLLLTRAPVYASERVFTGTGFAVTEDAVITNEHVISGCAEVIVQQSGVRRLGRIVGSDKVSDLALIRIAQKTAAVAILRASPSLRVGEQALTFGFPLAGALASDGNLTIGYVTSLRGLGDNAAEIQITTPIQPGNSGGPVLDASAHLIGVVVGKLDAIKSIRATGDIPQNVNFAIELTLLKRFLQRYGISAREAPSLEQISPPDVGDRAKAFTFLIACMPATPADVNDPPSKWPGQEFVDLDPRRRNPTQLSPRQQPVPVDVKTLKFTSISQPYPTIRPDEFHFVITNFGKHRIIEITLGFRNTPPSGACPINFADYDGLKKFAVDLPSGDLVNLRATLGAQARSFCIVKAVGLPIAEDFASASNQRAMDYAKKGQYDQAVMELTDAIGHDPSDYSLYFNRGLVFVQTRNFDQAVLDFGKVIELNAKFARAYYFRGVAFARKNDNDRAIADYSKAIEINPNDARYYHGRGWLLFQKKVYDQAINDYDNAIRINPKFAMAYNNRAWTYFKAGRAFEGLPDAQFAVELEPENALIVDTRAHIYEALGNKAAALADYKKAVALNPSQTESVEGLKRLTGK
jgi:tetratricopeptide (TPR) repeat protein